MSTGIWGGGDCHRGKHRGEATSQVCVKPAFLIVASSGKFCLLQPGNPALASALLSDPAGSKPSCCCSITQAALLPSLYVLFPAQALPNSATFLGKAASGCPVSTGRPLQLSPHRFTSPPVFPQTLPCGNTRFILISDTQTFTVHEGSNLPSDHHCSGV